MIDRCASRSRTIEARRRRVGGAEQGSGRPAVSRPVAESRQGRVRLIAAVLVLGAAAVLGSTFACVTGQTAQPAWNNPGVRLVWPPPPEQARIRYLGAIRSAEDLGRKVGLFGRVASWIFGEEDRGMVKPVSVAKNEAGLLAVADPTIPTVHLFDLEQRKYRPLLDELASLLRSPVGVAVDDAGLVYVADSVRGRVFVFSDGRELVAEIGEGVLERPTGIALGPEQERLYVVDTVACRVVVFDLSSGREVAGFGRRGVGPGEFNSPTYIGVAPDGTVGVSDSLNFRVQIFRPDGTPIRSFGQPGDGAGDFARPKGLAVDTFGRFYVVDAAFENVQIFDPQGRVLLAFGGPGTGPGEFYLPTGLFMDSTNKIWVADSFNRRVQVFQLLVDSSG